MRQPERICIIRLGGMGDVINALPALDAVRSAWPKAHIAWLVESQWAEILPGPPRLDEIIKLPKKDWLKRLRSPRLLTLPRDIWKYAGELKAKKFDLTIDLQGNLRSGFCAYWTHATVRAGYAKGICKECNNFFTNKHYEVGGGKIHRIDRMLALVKAVGAEPLTETPKIDVTEPAFEFARKAFDEINFSRPVVAIHPGTSAFGAYKRWPAENFNKLIRLLDHHGYDSLVTWGPGEEDMAKASAEGTKAVVSPRTGSVMELAALLHRCKAFVGADTGPGLLAAAVGTPTISLFGPKDPVMYAPRHARGKVVELDMSCRPCKKRTCDNPACITNIQPEAVLEKVLDVINE